MLKVNYEKMLKDFENLYYILYEYRTDDSNYIEEAEKMLKNDFLLIYIRKLVEIRRDFFSSDREIVALYLVFKKYGLIEAYINN